MSDARFDIAKLEPAVKPFRLHWFARLRSTNDHAARLRRQETLFAPSIVLASRQTHGRGRGENVWWSKSGSLTLTCVLRAADHLQPHQVPLLAGLAVREALQTFCGGCAIQLKWPNDLLHDDRKLAGLLCERIDSVDLIGVGVNVNIDPADAPAKLRHRITSLLAITGERVEMNDVVISIARRLRERLSRRNESQFSAVLKEYDRHHALVGRRISVSNSRANAHGGSTSGTCLGLDKIGRLLLRDARDAKTLHHVVAGHVVLR